MAKSILRLEVLLMDDGTFTVYEPGGYYRTCSHVSELAEAISKSVNDYTVRIENLMKRPFSKLPQVEVEQE